MKSKKTLIGLFALVCAIVAIFTLFADAFSGVSEYASSRGNVYQVMFGNFQGYDPVPGIIVAWSLLLAGAFFLLVGVIFPGKIGGIILGGGALFLLAGSIMFFFAPGMFASVANRDLSAEPVGLGVGLIVSAIFGIVGALIAFFGARTAMKE